MVTTPHMGLVVWDNSEDDFDHSQLASDLVAIDEHDHASGKGTPIVTASIEPGAITNALLAAGAVHSSNIQNGAVGASQIASSFLPLGTVVMWYRQSAETSLPAGGWEVVDGRAWSGVSNKLGPGEAALTTGNMPNMVGKFAKGAVATGPGTAIGDVGGNASVSLAHAHVVESHTHGIPAHTHSIPGHTHTISFDGEHAHQFHGNFPSVGNYNLSQGHVGVAKPSEYVEAVKLDALTTSTLTREIPIVANGGHSHSGSTGSTDGATGATTLTSGATAPNTDSKLSSTNVEPPYVGLLFLMRVR